MFIEHSKNASLGIAGKIRVHREISKFDLNNKFIKKYFSLSEASRDTNVLVSSICNCAKGDSKKAGGFIWRYSND